MAETQVTDTASQSSGRETGAIWMAVAMVVMFVMAFVSLVFLGTSGSGSMLVVFVIVLVGMIIGGIIGSLGNVRLLLKLMTGICFGGAFLLLASICVVTPAGMLPGLLDDRLCVETQGKIALLEGLEVRIAFPWARKVGVIPETVFVLREETETVGDVTITYVTKVSKPLPENNDELCQKIVSAGGLEEYLEVERDRLRGRL